MRMVFLSVNGLMKGPVMPKNRDTLFLVQRYQGSGDTLSIVPIECWPSLQQAEEAASSYSQDFLDRDIGDVYFSVTTVTYYE